jgi:hypothetical protein
MYVKDEQWLSLIDKNHLHAGHYLYVVYLLNAYDEIRRHREDRSPFWAGVGGIGSHRAM